MDLILLPYAPSAAGWGSDLFSADKFSVPGHFWHTRHEHLGYVQLSSYHWQLFHRISLNMGHHVWTRLLVLMLHGRPCHRWFTTVPLSVSRLMVRYTYILLFFSFLGVVKILGQFTHLIRGGSPIRARWATPTLKISSKKIHYKIFQQNVLILFH